MPARYAAQSSSCTERRPIPAISARTPSRSSKKLKGDNKELLIVPGASHTDLYDNFDKIPFDRIAGFYTSYLK